MFEEASRHGVFVLSQAGASVFLGGQAAWGDPSRFEDVLRAWPDVDVQLSNAEGSLLVSNGRTLNGSPSA